jgi:Fe-S-cluster-containing hydrogenase component 2
MQVSPHDCTGCALCKRVCGVGALSMAPLADVVQQEDANWLFSKSLPSRCVCRFWKLKRHVIYMCAAFLVTAQQVCVDTIGNCSMTWLTCVQECRTLFVLFEHVA